MARVQIDLPEKFPFNTTIQVRITDLNYGNHLGNDSVLSIVHEARVRFLGYLGYTELDVAGVGIIMADAAIQYKSEAFYGDELHIAVGVRDITKASFDLIYKITSNGRDIALVKTRLVCYDYTKKKIAVIPDSFLVALNT